MVITYEVWTSISNKSIHTLIDNPLTFNPVLSAARTLEYLAEVSSFS